MATKERILCTGDAAVNGPRNKLWDASLANWPRVLEKTIAAPARLCSSRPREMGGVEILTGQRQFLLDLYDAVKLQVDLQASRSPRSTWSCRNRIAIGFRRT